MLGFVDLSLPFAQHDNRMKALILEPIGRDYELPWSNND
jgi:hypothetical protein